MTVIHQLWLLQLRELVRLHADEMLQTPKTAAMAAIRFIEKPLSVHATTPGATVPVYLCKVVASQYVEQSARRALYMW